MFVSYFLLRIGQVGHVSGSGAVMRWALVAVLVARYSTVIAAVASPEAVKPWVGSFPLHAGADWWREAGDEESLDIDGDNRSFSRTSTTSRPDVLRRSSILRVVAAKHFQGAVQAWETQSLSEALNLFHKSAQHGHELGECCFRWGQYHELPPPNYKQALRWYKRGARSQHCASNTALGRLLMGLGQIEPAKEVLLKTATPRGFGGERGDSLAQWFLAEMSLKAGALRQAVRWWKFSAENGDTDAMFRLAKVFEVGGVGVPQEPMRSRHWLFAAAANGHEEALNSIVFDEAGGNVVRPSVEQRWIDTMRSKGWV